jgi:hypothetical protein
MKNVPFHGHLKNEHLNEDPSVDRPTLSEDHHVQTVKLRGAKIQCPFKIYF